MSSISIEGLRTRLVWVLVVASLAGATLLALPTVAAAQTPDDSSAVDQYVEDVPTGEGDAVPGSGKGTKTKLPPKVTNQIQSQGGSDAALLDEVASSSDYGAPQTKLKKAKQRTGSGLSGGKMERREGDANATAPEDDVSRAAAVSSAFGADGGAGSRIVGLLVVLFLMTLGAVAAAGVHSRRRSA